VKEVREALLRKPKIDYITFAGHGEPSLHMDFLEIVEGIKDLRKELAPEAKIALLTNSSKLSRPDVARVCRIIDAPICKLDSGNEDTFKRVNRPRPNIYIEDIVRSIKALPNAIVQTIIVEGEAGNSDDADVESLVVAIAKAKPASVQVYSIDFPLADGTLEPVPNERLTQIAELIEAETGIEAKAYWESK
jgi:wyosine [tRNA(Phe)-imidazoG37] synthetase (radical SAM superfamily)